MVFLEFVHFFIIFPPEPSAGRRFLRCLVSLAQPLGSRRMRASARLIRVHFNSVVVFKFKFSLAVVPVTVPGPSIIILLGNSSICLQIRCTDSESRYVNH
jgi:hypothetical protein